MFSAAGNFMYSTLNKLINVDQKLVEDQMFHEGGVKTDEPVYIDFVQDGENDFRISMDALPYIEL